MYGGVVVPKNLTPEPGVTIPIEKDKMSCKGAFLQKPRRETDTGLLSQAYTGGGQFDIHTSPNRYFVGE